MEDSEIILLMKNGDTRGLEEAISKYRGTAEAVAGRMLSDPADREEAVNDTFFKLWRYRLVIDPEKSSLKTFIGTVARSCSADRLRSIRRIKRQEVIRWKKTTSAWMWITTAPPRRSTISGSSSTASALCPLPTVRSSWSGITSICP